eukprot:307924-Chlamydomonas_euryale.AAC.1
MREETRQPARCMRGGPVHGMRLGGCPGHDRGAVQGMRGEPVQGMTWGGCLGHERGSQHGA